MRGAKPARVSAPAFGLGGESDVDRRGAGRLAQAAQRRDQRVPRAFWRVSGDQQAPARDGREGRRDLNLGIVAPARVFIGLRPAVVEDVLAHAVRLQIGRRRRDEAARFVLYEQVRGRPAGAAADRFGLFEREQKGVGNERIVPLARRFGLRQSRRIGAGIPRPRADRRDRFHIAGREPGKGHERTLLRRRHGAGHSTAQANLAPRHRRRNAQLFVTMQRLANDVGKASCKSGPD